MTIWNIFHIFFQKTGFDISHEMSEPIFWKKKKKNYLGKIINLSSAELAHNVVKVKACLYKCIMPV